LVFTLIPFNPKTNHPKNSTLTTEFTLPIRKQTEDESIQPRVQSAEGFRASRNDKSRIRKHFSVILASGARRESFLSYPHKSATEWLPEDYTKSALLYRIKGALPFLSPAWP
jgi:hypothetical protein